MERVVGLKRRSYLGLASPPALLSALLLFVTLSGLAGLALHLAFGLTRTETLITASVGCIAALLVHALQLVGSPRIACVLGVDGIEVTHGFDARIFGRFIPWSDVSSIDHSGSTVRFHLRDKRTLAVSSWTRPLYLDAVALLRAFRARKPVEESEGYRELDTDLEVLVRVVEDPRQDEARRRSAFEKLGRDRRSEVLSSLADPTTRDALAQVDE